MQLHVRSRLLTRSIVFRRHACNMGHPSPLDYTRAGFRSAPAHFRWRARRALAGWVENTPRPFLTCGSGNRDFAPRFIDAAARSTEESFRT
jgi:hypothetical protein